MQIDVISDLMCPWSFIGKRRLEQALARRSEIQVEIAWRAFLLNPDMPREGVERDTYLAAKFGSLGNAKRIYSAISQAGATVGIPFTFDRLRRTPNTRDAHRLVRYAAAQDAADAAVEAVFHAYFVASRDIGDHAVLTEIAGEIGLDAAEARAFLESQAAIEEVLSEDREARRSGLSAVPCFIFNRRYAVSGAHEPEHFVEVLDTVEKEAHGTQ